MTESISLTALAYTSSEPGFSGDGTYRYGKRKLVGLDKSTGTKYVVWYEDGLGGEVEDEIILSGGKGSWGSVMNLKTENSSSVTYVETIVQNKHFPQ